MSEALAARIIEHIRSAELAPGAHLRAQELAGLFNVSRFPVGQALSLLAEKGAVSHSRNRGYFVSEFTPEPDTVGLSSHDVLAEAYFKIADDHLNGRLPDPVSEAYLRDRYLLTKAQLSKVTNRIVREGWAELRSGYGWSFSQVLTTPESLEQTYRVRLAIEPAALLEPGYAISKETINRCRLAENRLLEGGIETDTADQLHERGVKFHEAIVAASGNPFFLETVKRINRVRRLLSYRSMLDRSRYYNQCKEHLFILTLLEHGKNVDASEALKSHLQNTLTNIQGIRDVLKA